MAIRLGVLVGLRSEAATLVSARSHGAVVEISGARPALARVGAQRLVDAGCTHLLSFGLAGGLADYLKAGDLMIPTHIVTPAERLPVDSDWHRAAIDLLSEMAPVTAPLAASEVAVASVEDKRILMTGAGAVAVDMESHHIARAAMAAGLPYLVIRVVADTAAQVLPPAALVGVMDTGNTDLASVLRSVLRHPGQIPALMALGRAASAAHRRLKRCDLLGGGLGFGLRRF